MYGPNTNIVVNGSIIFFSECEIRYIMGCIELLLKSHHAAMEPKKDVHDAYNQKIDAGNALMAWGAPQVSSWYKNEKGRVSQNWPFRWWITGGNPRAQPGRFRVSGQCGVKRCGGIGTAASFKAGQIRSIVFTIVLRPSCLIASQAGPNCEATMSANAIEIAAFVTAFITVWGIYELGGGEEKPVAVEICAISSDRPLSPGDQGSARI